MKYISIAIIAAAIGSFATIIISQILHRRRDLNGHNSRDSEGQAAVSSSRPPEIQKKVVYPPYHPGVLEGDHRYPRSPIEGSTPRLSHPVLDYQRKVSEIYGGSTPASIGDPLVPPTIAGPTGTYNNYPLTQQMASIVPLGSLRETNERYNRDQFRFTQPGRGLGPGVLPYQYPYGGSKPLESGINTVPSFYRPYGPNDDINSRSEFNDLKGYINTLQFFGSVNAYSPFQEIVSPWEKAGILTSVNKGIDGNVILNLYRRPIAPLQDLWEYQVQDANGFVIKLDNKYIEDGDTIRHIIGKDGLGPWRANIFVQNKYIWV